jgi:hypothetical protein
MLRFPDRPDALPLNLIWNFETTSTDKEPYMKKAVGLNGAAEIMRKEGGDSPVKKSGVLRWRLHGDDHVELEESTLRKAALP